MKKILCFIFLVSSGYVSFPQTFVDAAGKIQSFKFTANPDIIKIPQKLPDGENTITKMKSGNKLIANVKNGKITKVILIDQFGKQNNTGLPPGNKGTERIVVICMHCMGYMKDGKMFYECITVDCSSPDKNAERFEEVNKVKSQ